MMPSIATKPEIYIVLSNTINRKLVSHILYGMEEEGIPYKIEVQSITDVVRAAYQASTMSPLLVGVAAANDSVIVHYKNLPESKPLFTVNRFGALSREELRKIGCNAARLVKGIPFK